MKLGSKVKVVKVLNDQDRPLVGKVGIVTEYRPESICVQFKGWTQGHSGELDNNDVCDRWYFDPDSLKVVSRKKKPVRKKTTKRKKATR